jgi:hypothetical protein
MTNVFPHRLSNINARNIAKGVTHCLEGYQDILSVGERKRDRENEKEVEKVCVCVCVCL